MRSLVTVGGGAFHYIILLMEEILHHLGCIKPCKPWDKLPSNWCRISSINTSTSVYIDDLYIFKGESFQRGRPFRCLKKPLRLVFCNEKVEFFMFFFRFGKKILTVHDFHGGARNSCSRNLFFSLKSPESG